MTTQIYQPKECMGSCECHNQAEQKVSGKACIVQEVWGRVHEVCGHFYVISWNQLIIFPLRVSGEINKHTVIFTGTHLVHKNEVRVCVVMLWQLPQHLGGS